MVEDAVNDEPEKMEPKTVGTAVQKPLPKEIGGVEGPEPTRYGDWEHNGICTDF
jgi:hypothetical protein